MANIDENSRCCRPDKKILTERTVGVAPNLAEMAAVIRIPVLVAKKVLCSIKSTRDRVDGEQVY
mgnify:CR=1 FL=1